MDRARHKNIHHSSSVARKKMGIYNRTLPQNSTANNNNNSHIIKNNNNNNNSNNNNIKSNNNKRVIQKSLTLSILPHIVSADTHNNKSKKEKTSVITTSKATIMNMVDSSIQGRRQRSVSQPPELVAHGGIHKKDKTSSKTRKSNIVNNPIDGYLGRRPRAHTLPPDTGGYLNVATSKSTAEVNTAISEQPKSTPTRSSCAQTSTSATTSTATSTTTEAKTSFSPPLQRLSRPRSRTLPACLYETSLELTDITELDRSRGPHNFNPKSDLLPDQIQSRRTMKGGSIGQNSSLGGLSNLNYLQTLTARKKQILRRANSVVSFQSTSSSNNNRTLKQSEIGDKQTQLSTKEKIRATLSLPCLLENHHSKLTNRRGNVISLKKGQLTYVSINIGGGVRLYSESFELRHSSCVWLGS